jgi:ATP-dependent RNA circularization protein (DNA/RNA ligase family)
MSEKDIIIETLDFCERTEMLGKILKSFTGNKYLIQSAIEEKINGYNSKIVTNINMIRECSIK